MFTSAVIEAVPAPDIPGQAGRGAGTTAAEVRGSLATGGGTVGGPVYGDAADPVLPGRWRSLGAYGSSDG